MDLDELLTALRTASADPVVTRLCEQLNAWKSSPSTTAELRELVERYFGNTWIERDQEHQLAYELWSTFRDGAIEGQPGMTMNERLSAFSLLERYDAAREENTKATVLAKLRTPEEWQRGLGQ
jgi:hypothetical protein